jgi:hypothetical protein
VNDLRFTVRQFIESGLSMRWSVKQGVFAKACSLAGLCLGISLPALAASQPAAPGVDTAPPLVFSLKDQFDRKYTQASCAGTVALVIEADRDGSKFSGHWADAIGSGLKSAGDPPVHWLSVAALPSVPGFVQGFIKSQFPQDKTQPTLMDWRGQLVKAYGLQSHRCNVLIFGPDGRCLLCVGGREVDPAAVSSVVATIASAEPVRAANKADPAEAMRTE